MPVEGRTTALMCRLMAMLSLIQAIAISVTFVCRGPATTARFSLTGTIYEQIQTAAAPATRAEPAVSIRR